MNTRLSGLHLDHYARAIETKGSMSSQDVDALIRSWWADRDHEALGFEDRSDEPSEFMACEVRANELTDLLSRDRLYIRSLLQVGP
jgi:hypothetical protein